jgi:hypothetical protein
VRIVAPWRGGECALSTTQLHGFEMTTAVLLLFLLSTLVASESCGSRGETETLLTIDLFDLQQALDEISQLSRKSENKGNRRLIWPTA